MLLCHFLNAHTQAQTDSVKQEKNRHVIFSWSTGMLFIHKRPGQLAISFPYYASNLPSSGQFKGTLGNPFTQDLLLQDLINVEFLSLHHSIGFHIGLIPNDDHRNSSYSDAYFVSGGYSHLFSIGKCLMIKTGIDLSFYQFARGLGNIDNRNTDVQVLGYDSGPSFSTSNTLNNVTTTQTHTTDHLSVDFIENVLAFVPSLRVTSPTHKKLYWSIQASWFLPLIDKGGLFLSQVDSDGQRRSYLSRFGLIGLDQPDLTATFNGRPVTHSPYSFGGLCLGGTVGVCLPTGHKG